MKRRLVKRMLFVFVVACLTMGYAHAEETEKKPRENQLIVVNKRVNELAFYKDGELIRILKVATGKSASSTPEGEFKVIKMVKNMPYYKTNIPGGDPRNPLGPRWIGLDVPGTWGYTYGIHGNNAPWSIGTYASAGCVRMYNEEVTWLYDQVEMGAKVIITHSTGEFDDIARNRGYLMTVDKAKATDDILTIKKPVYVYKQPTKINKAIGTLQTQSVQTIKRYDKWYYIEADGLKGWIKNEDERINARYSVQDIVGYYIRKAEKEGDVSQRLKEVLATIPIKKSEV